MVCNPARFSSRNIRSSSGSRNEYVCRKRNASGIESSFDLALGSNIEDSLSSALPDHCHALCDRRLQCHQFGLRHRVDDCFWDIGLPDAKIRL